MSSVNTLTDRQRFDKLTEAVKLIREVEFSHTVSSVERNQMYAWVSSQCSFNGWLGQYMQQLKERIMLGASS